MPVLPWLRSGIGLKMTDDMPPPEPLATLKRERDEAVQLLTEIHNGFARDTDGGHYAFFGAAMYDRIKKVLRIDHPTVREMQH